MVGYILRFSVEGWERSIMSQIPMLGTEEGGGDVTGLVLVLSHVSHQHNHSDRQVQHMLLTYRGQLVLLLFLLLPIGPVRLI
jgi:hypothetical protein